MAGSGSAPLTTVTGPPGAGKTMSLALWAATRSSPGPCAWMTVDDYDNRPRVFWSYVTAALRAAGVPVTPLSPALASGNEASGTRRATVSCCGSRPSWPGRTRPWPWSWMIFTC